MNKLEELRIKSQKIRERILQIENELRQPLKPNPDDSASEEGNREVIYRPFL